MRFWFRELAGWALVVLGLFVFYLTLALMLSDRIIQAGMLSFIGFIIFRGGIHLLKVAVAARVCMMANVEATTERRRGSESAVQTAARRVPVR
ncbi:MAG: hypothetical protein FJ271_03345 [Planctomycetes bacterium]|nr:hypothetical protein [Planctomycetota bacterium]